MGILVNFVDRFFKRLQNGVSESFLEKAENSELHPDVIASMKRVQDDQDRLNEVINKWDLTKPKVKEVSIESKIKYKERKEVIKQIKSLFEQYFIEINEKKIEETEIIEYLKNKHNKSDLFCEEFLESYKDRIEYLIYEKELQEKKSEQSIPSLYAAHSYIAYRIMPIINTMALDQIKSSGAINFIEDERQHYQGFMLLKA